LNYNIPGMMPFLKTSNYFSFLLSVFCALSFYTGRAQVNPRPEPGDIPRPCNIKILEEHKDNKGNIIRTIQYDQGNRRVKETLIIKNNVNLHVPINPDTMNKELVSIIVSKSRYVVEVFYRNKMIRSYKAVFGPKPMEDKCMQGDRCTPEGWFTIRNKNPNSKYDKFMLLNYPNDTSYARFNKLKEEGRIPRDAKIGGDVGIHGIWKGGDDMIETGVCWTDGCVAIKNKDIEELFTFVSVGTRVFIKK